MHVVQLRCFNAYVLPRRSQNTCGLPTAQASTPWSAWHPLNTLLTLPFHEVSLLVCLCLHSEGSWGF